MSFAKALDRALKIKGLKPADIVSDEVSASYISKILLGRIADPTWQKALTMIKTLGMTVDEFSELEARLEGESNKSCLSGKL